MYVLVNKKFAAIAPVKRALLSTVQYDAKVITNISLKCILARSLYFFLIVTPGLILIMLETTFIHYSFSVLDYTRAHL